jgi:hypothetical protein
MEIHRLIKKPVMLLSALCLVLRLHRHKKTAALGAIKQNIHSQFMPKIRTRRHLITVPFTGESIWLGSRTIPDFKKFSLDLRDRSPPTGEAPGANGGF